MNKFASKRRFTICVVKKTTRSQSQFLFLSFFRSSANSYKRMMTFLPRHSVLPGPDSHRRSFIRRQFWSNTLTWRKMLNNPNHVLLLPALSGIMARHVTFSASCLYCFACLSMLQCELCPTPFLFSFDFYLLIELDFFFIGSLWRALWNVSVAAHLRGMRPTLTQRKAIQCLRPTQNIY